MGFIDGVRASLLSALAGDGGRDAGGGKCVMVALSAFDALQTQQRLFLLLVAQYVVSGTFRADVAGCVCDAGTLAAALRSGLHVRKTAGAYGQVLLDRFSLRAIQCLVTSLCVCASGAVVAAAAPESGGGAGGRGARALRAAGRFLQDAAVMWYVYPVVQDYRYGRSWVTRVLRAVAGVVYPRALREVFGFGPPPAPVSAGHPSSASQAAAEASFLYAPPPAPRADDAATVYGPPMPEGVAASLRFTQAQYRTGGPLRAVCAATLIPELSSLLHEQLYWLRAAWEERERPTSAARLLKPAAASLAGRATASVLCVLARYAGYRLGAALCPGDRTGAGGFWGERLLALAAAPLVWQVCVAAQQAVLAECERRWPATAADEEQDERERAEAEAEAKAANTLLNSLFGSAPGGGDDGNNSNSNNNNNNNGPPLRFDKGVDYYEALGVADTATAGEIKKAYRAAALKCHPDRVANTPDAQATARDRMAQLNDAYETLINDNSRAQYDAARMFGGSGNRLLQYVEGLSTPQLVALTVGSSVAAVGAVGVLVHLNWVLFFARLTAPGNGMLYG